MEIKKLFGYQSSKSEFKGKGVTISTDGNHYNILNLKSGDISIGKIARSLSRESRYSGDTHKQYSVAQHCVRGFDALILIGLVKEAKEFLLHDASEAFCKDIPKPLKDELGEAYAKIEDDVSRRIAEKFDAQYPWVEVIETIDKNLAQDEMTCMLETNIDTDYWTPDEAEEAFLNRWKKVAYYLENYYVEEGKPEDSIETDGIRDNTVLKWFELMDKDITSLPLHSGESYSIVSDGGILGKAVYVGKSRVDGRAVFKCHKDIIEFTISTVRLMLFSNAETVKPEVDIMTITY